MPFTKINNTNTDSALITSQTEKTSLVDADKFLITDSASSNAFKYVQKSNLPSGGLVHIKTISVTSSTAAITFLNGSNGVVLDNTYDVYKIIGNKIISDADDRNLRIQFTADGGSNYNSTIVRVTQVTEANVSGASSSSSSDYESSTTATIFGAMGANGSEAQYFEATLFKSNDDTYEKAMHIQSFEKQYNNIWKIRNSFVSITAGLNTNAIDGFKFDFATGNFANAQIRLYGVTNG